MITEAQLNGYFDRLKLKIAQLQHHADELERAVKRLEMEKATWQETHKMQVAKIRELQKKLNSQTETFTKPTKNSRIVKENPADAAEHAELKQKLDEYIREIEQIIAHLSTLS
jgi:chromosome segregation ATPase